MLSEKALYKYKWLPAVILALGFCFSFSIRTVNIYYKSGIYNHDDCISIIAAAGKNTDYQKAISGKLSGKWVKAKEWKYFLDIDELLPFKKNTQLPYQR